MPTELLLAAILSALLLALAVVVWHRRANPVPVWVRLRRGVMRNTSRENSSNTTSRTHAFGAWPVPASARRRNRRADALPRTAERSARGGER